MKAKVAKIKASGVTCFVNRQLIYSYPESLFAEAGIMSIEHADFEGVERLALVTGGEIASTFEVPKLVKLGKCDRIEEIMIGEDKVKDLSLSTLCPVFSQVLILRFVLFSVVDQVLWSRSRRSLYRRPPGCYWTNDRRSRSFPPRCPLGPESIGQGNEGYSRRWLRRDDHGSRGG